jgi:hypothetical protein
MMRAFIYVEGAVRRSSKIILAICGFILAFLISIYAPILYASKPEYTEKDAHEMLAKMVRAFEGESVEGVLSFVAPDAKVAGRDLERIRALLHQAFRYIRNGHVQYSKLFFSRSGETVTLRFDVHVVDLPPGSTDGGETLYSQTTGFTVKRIPSNHLLGLLTTYDWKITNVDAPNLPEEAR